VEIAPNASARTVGHELGHALSAGDLYKDGIDVNGNKLLADAPNSSGSIMKDLLGPANQQTLDEIATGAMNSSTNDVKYCTVNVFESRCE
jgi:hypothetical protein